MLSAVQGLAGIAGGIIGSGKRKREQREAQKEFDKNKARMEGADTSNVYTNMENTMEDLTVNTQQADFVNQQQQAGMANTMDKLSGAAGGWCWQYLDRAAATGCVGTRLPDRLADL